MRIFSGNYKKGEPQPEAQPIAGKGKHLGRRDAERFIVKLLADDFLQEELEMSHFGCRILTSITYGPRADELLRDEATFSMPIIIPTSDQKKKPKKEKKGKIEKKEEKGNDTRLLELELKCRGELCMLTETISKSLDVKFHRFLPLEAIMAMSSLFPSDEESLLQIDHVTSSFCSKYGQKYLDVIKKFADERSKIMNEINESRNVKPEPVIIAEEKASSSQNLHAKRVVKKEASQNLNLKKEPTDTSSYPKVPRRSLRSSKSNVIPSTCLYKEDSL